MRNTAAQPPVFRRIFQKADDFLQLLLGFVHTGDIVKGDLDVFFHVDFGAVFADGQKTAASVAHTGLFRHASHQKHPDTEKDSRRNDPAQYVGEKRILDNAGEFHIVRCQLFGQRIVHPGRREIGFAVDRLFQDAPDFIADDINLSDVSGIELLKKGTVRQRFACPVIRPETTCQQYADHGKSDVPEQPLVPSGVVVIHVFPPVWFAG